MRLFLALAASGLAGAVAVAESPVLPLPSGAERVAQDVALGTGIALPFGPWADGKVPLVQPQGRVVRRVWQVAGWDGTPEALLRPLREQLIADGFSEVYSCAARVCGGFDFRFALDLLPAPEMFVDLSDYVYVLTERARGGARTMLALLASRGAGTGYIHLTAVGPDIPAGNGAAAPEEAPQGGTPAAPPPVLSAGTADGTVGEMLTLHGRAVLDGLAFAPGSSRLSDEDYRGLAELAAFLDSNPGTSVALVGHTDAVGGLSANIALSRARGDAVRTRLIDGFGVPPQRVTAEGAGYLAPRASNLSAEGRAANRRVEVVLLSQ